MPAADDPSTGISAGAGDTGQTLDRHRHERQHVVDPRLDHPGDGHGDDQRQHGERDHHHERRLRLHVPAVSHAVRRRQYITSAATATATVITNGVVTAITVSGGSGYSGVPLVSIAPPVSNATATVTRSAAARSARVHDHQRRLRLSEPADDHTSPAAASPPRPRRSPSALANGVVTVDHRDRRLGLHLGAAVSIATPGTGVGALMVNYVQGAATGTHHLHPGGGRQRHGRYQRHRDRQRQRRIRRPPLDHPYVHGGGRARQPWPRGDHNGRQPGLHPGRSGHRDRSGRDRHRRRQLEYLQCQDLIVSNFVAGQDILAFSPNPRTASPAATTRPRASSTWSASRPRPCTRRRCARSPT